LSSGRGALDSIKIGGLDQRPRVGPRAQLGLDLLHRVNSMRRTGTTPTVNATIDYSCTNLVVAV